MRIAVRLTPRARAEKIDGVAAGMLKVSVTAPPADNEANEALLRLLAREWRLARRDLSIIAGPNKIVRVSGDRHALMTRLTAMIVGTPA